MLRNKEFRKFFITYITIALIAVVAGFIFSIQAGTLTLVTSVIYCALFFIFTKARHRSIAKISSQIDLILHNDDNVYIDESDEGELAILQSEIMKMTIRIREQNDALKKEKEHLADSVADIAHQLRTPLTSVNLILSLLENTNDEHERKAMIREAEELLVQMDWLLTSLLKLSRLDAGIVVFKIQEVEVKSLIKEAIHTLQIPMELHNIELKTDLPNDVMIKGDMAWLSQAVMNIVKNCMESVGTDGNIDITCTDTTLYTEITIHDSGKGFNDEDLPHIFDRFYRGKNAEATGYGIGLALCKMIIARQGGTVNAKNHKLGGALFIIRFPK